MLLMSVCSFAQNPLSGDVNDDGKVNVADIVAVIKNGGVTVDVEAIAAILNIMKNAGGGVGETTYYWYVGQTQPTANNYTSLATHVNEYTSPIDYTNPTRSWVYILIHNTKSITNMIDPTNNFDQAYSEITSDISEYKIYKTQCAAGGTIRITIQ